MYLKGESDRNIEIPVGILHHRFDLRRAETAGVGAADQAAHAGAGEIVDGNAMLLEPPQQADMGDAARRAAAERQTQFRAWLLAEAPAVARRGSGRGRRRCDHLRVRR